MSPSPKIKQLQPISQSAGGSPPAAMPQQAEVQTPLSLSNAAIAADALRRGQISDLRNSYDYLRSFDERLAFLLSLTPEQQRAIAGGSSGVGASKVFEKIEKEHQPNWWLMEDLASSTVLGAPLIAGGLAAGPIAAATSVLSKVAFARGVYGTAQELVAAIRGKSPDGQPLSEKDRARAIFHAASGLFGLSVGALMAFSGQTPRVKTSTSHHASGERLSQKMNGGGTLGPGAGSAGTKTPSQFRVLVVGAETEAEFAYAAEVARNGQQVLVVNPRIKPAAESYAHAGGNFVQGRVEDLPREPSFNLIREDFPYPLGKAFAPTLKFVRERLLRLKSGGRWVVVTEKVDEWAPVLELAAEESRAKIFSRHFPERHEAAPQSEHPKEHGRIVLVIEKP